MRRARLIGVVIAAAVVAVAMVGIVGRMRAGASRHAIPAPVARALAAARKVCGSANIVIVCLDAARRDHAGCYGYDRPTSPEVDRVAAGGVRFENAVTDATYTLAACASLWTGQYPDTHGASLEGVGMRIPRDLTTLPEACKAAGMRTAVITSSGIIIRPHGFADGVDDFVRVYASTPSVPEVPNLQRAWRKWLEGIGNQRFFLYIHIIPPHHPYELSGQFRGKFDPDYHGSLGPTKKILFDLDAGKLRVSERDRRHIIAMYDENFRFGDWALETLVQDLRQRGVLDNTILVVFSDHGEAFGEHGRWLHSNTVYDELTHNLLVMRLPPGVQGAQHKVSGLAQLSDIAPTLASLAGLPLPSAQVQGYDLSPEILGDAPMRDAAFSRCLREPRQLWSVEVPGAKGIFDRQDRLLELYDLQADPGEHKNLAGADRALAGRITRLWRNWARQQKYVHGAPPTGTPAPPPGLDRKTIEWLKSMGYIQGNAPAPANAPAGQPQLDEEMRSALRKLGFHRAGEPTTKPAPGQPTPK